MRWTQFLVGVLSVLLLPLATCAQKPLHISLELAGSGGLGSVNIEKRYWEGDNWEIQGRLGFSYIPIDANNGGALIFPVMAHGLYGGGDHRADLGLGQTFSLTTKGSAFVRLPLSFGYRFMPRDRRFFFRAAYTPIVSYLVDRQWEHWAGITFGFRITD